MRERPSLQPEGPMHPPLTVWGLELEEMHKASWEQLLSVVTTTLSVYHVYILKNCFLGSQTKLLEV